MFLERLKTAMRPSLAYVTVVTALGLVVIGLGAIDVATESSTADWSQDAAMRQGIFLLVALAVGLAVALLHHRQLADAALPLALISVLLLVLLLLPAMPHGLVPVRNGAKRWINLGLILFQPSELAKIAFVLMLARYLRYRRNYRTLGGLLVPLGMTLVPMALIVVEPDLGTAMLFPPVAMVMLLAAGAKMRHLVAITLLALVLMPAMYPLLRPHQRARVDAMVARFTGEGEDRQGAGFQAHQAITATGAGQLTGYGRERVGVMLRYNALPEAHNDMIFAVVSMRWGFVGGASLLGLYLLLCGSALWVAAASRDPFARLAVVGVVGLLVTQLAVCAGMTMGLLPITGMTLPLVSYGGSSLVCTFAMLGVVVSAGARPLVRAPRGSFEF